MKYKLRFPEVDIIRCTNSESGRAPIYEVTYHDGKKEFITEHEFYQNFVPIQGPPELAKLETIRKLAQSIIDFEMLADEDNFESLLHQAIEIATQIKRLTQ